MPPQTVLRTERLVLRAPAMSDAEAIYRAYASDPEVTRYLAWAPHKSVAETEEYLRGVEARRAEGREYLWLITEQTRDEACGAIALRPQVFKADFGYVIARRLWGRGYMTEALRAVIDFGFALPGIYRVWGICDAENVGSARVMEKAGLDFEGVLRRYVMHPSASAEPRDARCYAKTR